MSTAGIREIGGNVLAVRKIETSSGTVEFIRRAATGPLSWKFQQPVLTLLWWYSGVKALDLEVDGRSVRSDISPSANFALIPPMTRVAGEFAVSEINDYAVAFFDPTQILKRARYEFERPLIAFGNQNLQRGLESLSRESENADGIFQLYSEGWAIQAIVQLARIAGTQQPDEAPRGGLAPTSLRRVREFILEDMSRTFRVEELAKVAGLSRRHFMRAFKESIGQTPHRYIQGLRIAKARDLLVSTTLTATDIALSCGFCHAQHFSTNFREATGVSPMRYRRRS